MNRINASKVISLRVEEHTLDKLDCRAEKLQITRSELIRRILRKEAKSIVYFRKITGIRAEEVG